MKIGISGHQRFENLEWVKETLEKELVKLKNECDETGEKLIGISSLAIGADQLFADFVLKLGGELIAVLPFEDYERTHEEGIDRDRYFSLLEKATSIKTLPAQNTDQESFMEAGKYVVKNSDILMTVWNGKKAAGLGGTGDAIKYARKRGKKIIHLNPVNCEIRQIE